jgi:hypothetical protein
MSKHPAKNVDGAQGGRGNEKPVSLAPLSFDEALDGLLAVKPEPKGEASKAASKKPAMKSAKKRRS